MTKRMILTFAAIALAAAYADNVGAKTQAGVSAAVRGDIDLVSSGQAAHKAVSGEEIFLGDEISSHDQSGMQLMLLDETVFTIGENTDLTVDEFVYDPATGAGQVTASLAKGVFRFVTGKIAQGDPEDMMINLPVGTIGIRGTIGAASLVGGIAAVVLLGPGPDNNANARPGHLEVTAQGMTVNLTRPRYGTIIEPGLPPSLPVLFTDAQVGVILATVAPPPSADKPSDTPAAGTATLAANQNMAEASNTSRSFLPPPNPIDKAVAPAPTGLDGTTVTTFEQLRDIQTGTGSFDINIADFTQTRLNGQTVNILGHFHANLSILFASKEISGSISVDTIEDGNKDTIGGVLLGDIDFSSNSASTKASLDYSQITGPAAGSFDSIDVEFKQTTGAFINANGIIANLGLLNVVYDEGPSGDAGVGFGVTTRQ